MGDPRAVFPTSDDILSAWHPLKGPTQDWPLAVCDASTVDFENDAVPGDIVQVDRVTENMQIHYNDDQKWYYLSNQMPSEMLLFKNADSETPRGAHCGELLNPSLVLMLCSLTNTGAPHASFDLYTQISPEARRESIEVRILAMWDK